MKKVINSQGPVQVIIQQGESKKIVRKSPLDFIVIAIGIILIVVRFTGGVHFFSYIGCLLVLLGAFAPLKSNHCKYCKSQKDLKAVVCPQCGKRQGVSMGAVCAGIALFAVWFFIEFMIGVVSQG